VHHYWTIYTDIYDSYFDIEGQLCLKYMINLIISIAQKYITTVSILILYSKALFAYGDVFEKQLFLFCKFSIKATRYQYGYSRYVIVSYGNYQVYHIFETQLSLDVKIWIIYISINRPVVVHSLFPLDCTQLVQNSVFVVSITS
jgi:hypothetical protein